MRGKKDIHKIIEMPYDTKATALSTTKGDKPKNMT